MVCPAIGLPPRRKDPLCGRGGSVSPPAHQEVLPSRPPAHGTVGQPSVARVSGREPLGGRRGAIVAGDGRLGVGDGEGGKGRCCRRLLCVVAAVVAAAATTVRLWVRQAHGRSRPTCGGVWAYAQGAQWPHPGRACPQLRWRSHRDWQLATEVVGAPAAAPTHGAATVGRGRGGGDVLGEVAEEAAAAATAGWRRRLQRQRRPRRRWQQRRQWPARWWQPLSASRALGSWCFRRLSGTSRCGRCPRPSLRCAAGGRCGRRARRTRRLPWSPFSHQLNPRRARSHPPTLAPVRQRWCRLSLNDDNVLRKRAAVWAPVAVAASAPAPIPARRRRHSHCICIDEAHNRIRSCQTVRRLRRRRKKCTLVHTVHRRVNSCQK